MSARRTILDRTQLVATQTAPAASYTANSPVFTVSWSLAQGSTGAAPATPVQNTYRIDLYDSGRTTLKFTSGELSSATQSGTVALVAIPANGTVYSMQVTVRDTAGAASTSPATSVTGAWATVITKSAVYSPTISKGGVYSPSISKTVG